jgi:hypothetical protein
VLRGQRRLFEPAHRSGNKTMRCAMPKFKNRDFRNPAQMPDTVHQFWFDATRPVSSSAPLPALAQLSLESFVKNSGCRVKLWSYQRFVSAQGVGTPTADAESVLPFADFKKHLSKNHIAHVCDYLRYLLVLKHGGWWADMDCVCIRRLPDARYAFATQPGMAYRAGARFRQFQDVALGRFSNAVFRCPQGALLMTELIGYMQAALKKGITDWDSVMFAHAGFVRALALEAYVAPPVQFGPFANCRVPGEHDRRANGFLYPGMASIRKGTYVLDCWSKQHAKIRTILQRLDTPGTRKLLPTAALL